jgi:hypothetical protein
VNGLGMGLINDLLERLADAMPGLFKFSDC